MVVNAVHVRTGTARDAAGWYTSVEVRVNGVLRGVWDGTERYTKEKDAWDQAQETRRRVLERLERMGGQEVGRG